MRNNDIDKILYTQLIIARMGEKELMNWWNTDIAHEMAEKCRSGYRPA